MGLDEKRSYRSDDRDLENRDNTLIVNMGGNGDWYVMVVKTGEKYGPTVRVTTSGAMRGQNMAAPAIGNLYRALGGERPFVLISRDELDREDLEQDGDEPKVIWVSNYRQLGHEERMPIRVLEDGTVEAVIPRHATADANGWRRLSAERPATWAWKQVFEDLTAQVERLKAHLQPHERQQEVMGLRQQVAELQTQLETMRVQVAIDRAEAERWRKDAIEDKPAREVLEEVRGVLGVGPGQSLAIAAQRLVFKAQNLTDALRSIGVAVAETIAK